MTLKCREKLCRPDIPAVGNDADTHVGVVRAENVLPVAGAVYPGIHDVPGQGHGGDRAEVGTLPDVFPPAVDRARVEGFEALPGGQTFGIGMAEKVADQHVHGISLGNP